MIGLKEYKLKLLLEKAAKENMLGDYDLLSKLIETAITTKQKSKLTLIDGTVLEIEPITEKENKETELNNPWGIY